MTPPIVETPQQLQGRLLREWRMLMDAGRPRLGWKIAFNDPRAQRVYGTRQSMVGFMTGESLGEQRERFAPSELVVVEPEIALFLGRDVDPREAPDSAASAVIHAGPALEVLRMDQPRRTLAEVMAHNFFHRGVFFGGRGEPGIARAGTVRLETSGRVIHEVPHAKALPPFGEIVALVAGTLAEHRERLAAGDVIISGAMTPPIPIEPGGSVHADFGNLGRFQVGRSGGGRAQFSFQPWTPT